MYNLLFGIGTSLYIPVLFFDHCYTAIDCLKDKCDEIEFSKKELQSEFNSLATHSEELERQHEEEAEKCHFMEVLYQPVYNCGDVYLHYTVHSTFPPNIG